MHYLIFILALFALLLSARFFTKSAETIGKFFGLPTFVIGVFIVGIGTSLPELISGIISVSKQSSEILSGNIIGANISNILLITGLAVVMNRKTITMSSGYIYIDLHYLIGSIIFFFVIAYDGHIGLVESQFGLLLFIVYCIYLIKGEPENKSNRTIQTNVFPVVSFLILTVSAVRFLYFQYVVYPFNCFILWDNFCSSESFAVFITIYGSMRTNVLFVDAGQKNISLGRLNVHLFIRTVYFENFDMIK